ncbi:YchJ family metal-binding protein, partial [Pseudomonas syringae group genomosp. 7]|uniref:YchJ family metal-binding protein n=1 Tax=Pseudomonas syringae group genomosp. 7 TaxID=251699 RepID=UPI00376F9095
MFGGKREHAFVTFTAGWHVGLGVQSHKERSSFVQYQGCWYFIDSTVALMAGGYDACPCGSEQLF